MSYFKVIKFDAIDSTNNYLKKLYLKKSIQDRLLIIANNQFKVCETITELNEAYQNLVRKKDSAA